MLTFSGVEEMQAHVGRHLGVSNWHYVDQATILNFASATKDFESIHVDPVRGREAGLGGTIAHGLYTLSMGPAMMYEIYVIEGHALWLNYGYDTVRFLSPVRVGSRLRLSADLVSSAPIAGGLKFTVRQTFEIEGQEKPACVADNVIAYFHALPHDLPPGGQA